jgi:hypothetical protein
VLNGARHLSQVPGHIEEVHFVILLANLVRQAACPSLDLVELELLLVVPCLAHVHGLVCWQPTRPAPRISRDEHDKAAVLDVFDAVVAVLTRLDHLVFVEVLVEPMDCLLRAVIPAHVHPFLA